MGLRETILRGIAGLLAAPRAAVKPSRSAQVLRQQTYDASGKWTPTSVQAAIDAHEVGNFSESAQLATAMGRDDRMSACLKTRLNAITGANGIDFAIVPPDGGTEELAKRVELWWPNVMTDAVQRALASDTIMMGVAIGRVHWEIRAKEWLPVRVEHWHLSGARFDTDLQRYVVAHQGGEEVIEPGDPNWLVIEPGGQQSWMCGAVRALGMAYVMRQWNWRDWARFNERHGLPILVLKEPSGMDKDVKDGFFASVRRMGSTGILRLPTDTNGEGYDAQMLEAKDNGFDTFDKFKDALNVAIAVCLLGQNLTTEVSGGSFAAAKVANMVRSDYLIADTEVLSSAERDGIIKPWGRYNVAGWDDDKAPWPYWDCEPAEDLTASAGTFETLGKALTQLKANKVPVDIELMAERFNIPLVEGAKLPDFTEDAPAPVAVPPEQVDTKKPAKAQLRSGPQAKADGFVDGQLYVDDVVDNARAKAGEAFAGSLLADLLDVINGQTDYEGLREAVLAKYASAKSPDEVRDLVRKALVLADLAGVKAVRDDS